MAEPAARAWRCTVCGYIHRGPTPPQACPVCGAAASEFEPYLGEIEAAPGEEAVPAAGTGSLRALIVGAGIAGLAAAEAIRGASPKAAITVLSREPDLPYYRLSLTRYLAGEIGLDALPIHPRDWYAANRIELLPGAEAVEISCPQRTVRLRDGRRLAFDKLVLASGAHPFVPPLPGVRREGVMTLRTVADAKAIVAALRPGMSCVCVGGGLLGLETAGGLAQRGARVTVLEGQRWLMPRQLNQAASEFLERHIAGLGIVLTKQARTRELAGDEHVAGVVLQDGREVQADLVVIAAGVRSNMLLPKRAGLTVNKGVVVDRFLRASRPDVFAAGDVAEFEGMQYGAWSPAQFQGTIAGLNAAGGRAEFGGLPRAHALKVLGLENVSIGQFEAATPDFRVLEEGSEESYLRFVFREARMVGAVLLGKFAVGAAAKKAIENKVDCAAVLTSNTTARDVVSFLESPG